MKRLALVVAALMLLAGSRAPADGYVFGKPTWVQTDLRIKIVLVPSTEEMNRIKPENAPRDTMAFAVVRPNGVCTIYKVDSRVRYAPEWDGHELNHCIYGEWHR